MLGLLCGLRLLPGPAHRCGGGLLRCPAHPGGQKGCEIRPVGDDGLPHQAHPLHRHRPHPHGGHPLLEAVLCAGVGHEAGGHRYRGRPHRHDPRGALPPHQCGPGGEHGPAGGEKDPGPGHELHRDPGPGGCALRGQDGHHHRAENDRPGAGPSGRGEISHRAGGGGSGQSLRGPGWGQRHRPGHGRAVCIHGLGGLGHRALHLGQQILRRHLPRPGHLCGRCPRICDGPVV